jgi:hypothetical protein
VTWHHGGAGYGAAGWSFEVTATRRSKLSPAPIRPIMFQSLARELSGGKRRECVHLLQRRLDVQIRFVRRVRQSSGPHADIINLHHERGAVSGVEIAAAVPQPLRGGRARSTGTRRTTPRCRSGRMARYRKASLSSNCGDAFTASDMRPDAWPITSCMSMASSPEKSANVAARSASSGDHANSPRIDPGVDRF